MGFGYVQAMFRLISIIPDSRSGGRDAGRASFPQRRVRRRQGCAGAGATQQHDQHLPGRCFVLTSTRQYTLIPTVPQNPIPMGLLLSGTRCSRSNSTA